MVASGERRASVPLRRLLRLRVHRDRQQDARLPRTAYGALAERIVGARGRVGLRRRGGVPDHDHRNGGAARGVLRGHGVDRRRRAAADPSRRPACAAAIPHEREGPADLGGHRAERALGDARRGRPCQPGVRHQDRRRGGHDGPGQAGEPRRRGALEHRETRRHRQGRTDRSRRDPRPGHGTCDRRGRDVPAGAHVLRRHRRPDAGVRRRGHLGEVPAHPVRSRGQESAGVAGRRRRVSHALHRAAAGALAGAQAAAGHRLRRRRAGAALAAAGGHRAGHPPRHAGPRALQADTRRAGGSSRCSSSAR